MIILEDELEENTVFIVTNNILYINSTKCKRVIRVVFTLKLYAIVIGIDILILIAIIIKMVINKLSLYHLLIIVCINYFSLYKCIIKLGTIKEKRLIINIILIR
jgi:hypothetical protein